METLIALITAFAGPQTAKWIAGTLAGLGAIVALIVSRQRGRRQGRREAESAHALKQARQKAKAERELAAIRGKQGKAALERPDDGRLSDILKRGDF